jgi:prepilin-type processing-associated H-X9-DG protein
MVIIAVIGVLACLLLPAQARNQEGTKAIGCLANTGQIGRGILMYSGDNRDYFPSTPDINWVGGPYQNSKGLACGGEWFGPDKKTPNTPAPMLVPYLPNNRIWVCPKRKRGLTYKSEPGEFDPNITGFLSYEFNEVGVFAVSVSPGSYKPFKAANASKPSEMMMSADSSGSNDPANAAAGSTAADGAWLDVVWAGDPVGNPPSGGGGKGHRLVLAYAKHNKRVNVIYVDGHAAPSLPSKLTWGQFYGNSDPTKSAAFLASAICLPVHDAKEWSFSPE